MADQLWNPFGPVEVPGTKKPAPKPKAPPTLGQAIDQATNPLKYTEKPKGTPENPNQFQLDAQKARGGKSFADTQKTVPGTWEYSVAIGRKSLGIKEGSADDQSLKSLLWMARDQSGRVSQEDAQKAYRRVLSAKNGSIRERAAIDQDIQAFRSGKNPALVSTGQTLPFDNWEEALRTQGPVKLTRDFGPYKKGQVIGFTDAEAIVKDFTGKQPEFKPYTEDQQALDLAPRAAGNAGFAGKSVAQQEADLKAAREAVAKPVTVAATAAANVINPLGITTTNNAVGSFVGGAVADTAFSPLDLGQAIADPKLSTGERIGLGINALVNMIPALGDLPIKIGIEAGGRLLAALGKAAEPSGFVAVSKLLREAGVENADSIAKEMMQKASTGELGQIQKLGEQIDGKPLDLTDPRIAAYGDMNAPKPGEPAIPYRMRDGKPVIRVQADSREVPGLVKPAEDIPKPATPKPEIQTSPKVDIPAQPEVTGGLTHAETAQIRTSLDLSQYVKTSKPLETLLVDADKVDVDAAVKDVLDKARPFTDTEQAAVISKFHQTVLDRDAVSMQIVDAINKGDLDEAARLEMTGNALDGKIAGYLEASDKAGSEWGRSGRARQLEIANSEDPNILKYRYYKSIPGPKNPEVERLAQEVTSLKAELAAATDREAAQQVKLADNIIKDPARQRARVNYTRKTTKEDYDRAARIWQSGGVRGSKQRGAVAAVSAEQWKALKTMARYHLDNGLENAADIVNKIIEVVGDTVDKVTIARAVKEAAVDESRALNTGRALGEDYLERGANAIESKEIRELRFKADRKVAEFKQFVGKAEKDAEFAKKSVAAKVFHIVGDVLGTVRTIKSSFDLSAGGRQGLLLSITNPKAAAKSWKNMLKAISDKGFERVNWEISQNDYFNEAMSAKLALTDAHGIGPREEQFIGNLVGNLPGIKQSEQTYTAFLNTLRMDTFAGYVKILEDGGNKLTRDDLTIIADWVNMATGRGDLGKFEGAGDTLAKILYSPRFLKSRIDLVTAKPLLTAIKNPKSAAARLVAKEYLKVVGLLGMTLGLAKAAGITNLDPRSSKFGKIQVGNVTFDVLAGMGNIATLLARVGAWAASGIDPKIPVRFTYADNKPVYRGSPYADPLQMTTRFVQGKVNPALSSIYYGASGKDYMGDPTTPADQAGKTLLPINVENVIKNKKDKVPAKDAALSFALDFFGFGSSVDTPAKPNK